MKKKLFRHLMGALLIVLVIVPVFSLALPVYQANALDETTLWGGKETDVQSAAGFDADPSDPREIAGMIINVALGFLGIIALALVLIGGFKWMMAGGSDEKVTEARKLIISGIIGLLIVVSSYAIASFVLGVLVDVTT
ncbi:MAG: hypothetical protein ABIE43_01405 [Patescibacteria group bacterium]